MERYKGYREGWGQREELIPHSHSGTSTNTPKTKKSGCSKYKHSNKDVGVKTKRIT